ncbi:fungal-specific transcription factor domain-containing protein [Bisporella sp. PMI_857]|nr:fungal-specific transcription factor domain-containing protein [Bisporella sp. PMI_857]
MSSSARSTKGCWTCRLRKKKCDEGKPVCLSCNNLAITCHRYGPKPEWMDGKRREKDMAETIRRAVKETTAEKKRIAMKRRQQPRQQSNGYTNNAAAKEPTHPTPPATTLPSAAQTDWSDGWGGRTMNRVSPLIATDHPLSDFSVVPGEIDAELLMHYLDHVFPLQFPFYKPSVIAGGRGWLLSILTTTKPLYHAAISLAAYHRRSMLCRDSASKDHGLDLESLGRQYARALSELRQYLAKIGDKNEARTQVENIEVLSCLAMLISLEIFKGDARNWRMHLSAAAVLIPDIKREERVAEYASLSSGYRSALFFFSGVVGWYDILSCSTTGAPPFSKCECIDAALGYVFLDKIMGCENWAMLLIMDIAFLDDWKQNLQRSAQLSMRELVTRATHIERRLEDGIRDNSSRLSQLTNHSMPSILGTRVQEPTHLILLITRIFACSALVYLDVVVSGAYPEMPEIRENVSRTIDALRALPEKAMINSLTWAYCIAGCMAIEEEQMFFRGLAVSSDGDAPTFGNFLKALPVIEECWRLRREEKRHQPVDWRTAINSLGMSVLLV